MITKDSNELNSLLDKLGRPLSGFPGLWQRSVLIALFACLLFTGGILFHRSGALGLVVKPILTNRMAPVNLVKGYLSNPERITIDLSWKNHQKLAYSRQLALQEGFLLPEFREEVTAFIRYRDKVMKANVRLKGDMSDHWQDRQKWSFRIRITGENTLFSMKRFSIQHPGTRNYIYEWLFHQALKREGLLSLRYKFVDVTLNGKNLGVYALEEHFDKRLIEHNQRREGPIIKFDESNWWRERIDYDSARSLPGAGNYYSAPIDMFQTNRVMNDSALFTQYKVAANLLAGFRRGELTASQVFDVPAFARFIALCDLFGTLHPLHANQLRFYYNPVLSILEPIPFDANAGRKLTRLSSTVTTEDFAEWHGGCLATFITTLFEDNHFYESYIQALKQFSDSSYLDSLFIELDDELQHNLNLIYHGFPLYQFSSDVLYQNQEYIKRHLNPVKGFHAHFFRSHKDRIVIELGNIQTMPIEVLNIIYNDSTEFQIKDQLLLSPKDQAVPVSFHNVDFILPAGFIWSDSMVAGLKVNYRLPGSSRLRYETVFPWSHLEENFIDRDFVRLPSNCNDFEFMVVDDSSGRVFIKPGNWKLDRGLIIPAGYKVICDAGTHLDLSNSAKILSYSPFRFFGTEDDPIVICSTDSTGQGVAVFCADEPSRLENVTFDNLSNPSQGGWSLTGAVTFYESPVEIYNCRFSNVRSEDALNVIRADCLIDRTIFNNSLSDAFDGDFCTCTITNTNFITCGNDAVDVSGSVLNIKRVIVNGAGDKALSIGENSRAMVNIIEITNAEIAFASKDMSELIVNDATISDCKIGFALYQKKTEFGAASATATNLKVDNIEVPYMVEDRSVLSVDGREVGSNEDRVKELLYGVKYGKSSK